jgi:hypothetical protein
MSVDKPQNTLISSVDDYQMYSHLQYLKVLSTNLLQELSLVDRAVHFADISDRNLGTPHFQVTPEPVTTRKRVRGSTFYSLTLLGTKKKERRSTLR